MGARMLLLLIYCVLMAACAEKSPSENDVTAVKTFREFVPEIFSGKWHVDVNSDGLNERMKIESDGTFSVKRKNGEMFKGVICFRLYGIDGGEALGRKAMGESGGAWHAYFNNHLANGYWILDNDSDNRYLILEEYPDSDKKRLLGTLFLQRPRQ